MDSQILAQENCPRGQCGAFFRHDTCTHDGIGCVDDRHCALDLVRQPELSPTRSMHAEVQKALSCAQLPTLDGSWRKKLSAFPFGIFSTFFRS